METILLPKSTCQSLLILNSLGNEEIITIFKSFLQNIVVGKNNAHLDDLDQIVDDCVDAISTLYLQAVKSQTSQEVFRAFLQEIGVLCHAVDTLSGLYIEYNDTLTSHLRYTGISMPHIVDMDWRLDYFVRSSVGGKENKPIFFVTLKVKDQGQLKNIDILVSYEELQDLCYKIRDAVKQVDRLLSKSD